MPSIKSLPTIRFKTPLERSSSSLKEVQALESLSPGGQEKSPLFTKAPDSI